MKNCIRVLTEFSLQEGLCIIFKDPLIVIEINDKIGGLLNSMKTPKKAANSPYLRAVCFRIQLECVSRCLIGTSVKQREGYRIT
jgi:hypothetical protein